jgi:hypothetical protein
MIVRDHNTPMTFLDNANKTHARAGLGGFRQVLQYIRVVHVKVYQASIKHKLTRLLLAKNI